MYVDICGYSIKLSNVAGTLLRLDPGNYSVRVSLSSFRKGIEDFDPR